MWVGGGWKSKKEGNWGWREAPADFEGTFTVLAWEEQKDLLTPLCLFLK